MKIQINTYINFLSETMLQEIKEYKKPDSKKVSKLRLDIMAYNPF